MRFSGGGVRLAVVNEVERSGDAICFDAALERVPDRLRRELASCRRKSCFRAVGDTGFLDASRARRPARPDATSGSGRKTGYCARTAARGRPTSPLLRRILNGGWGRAKETIEADFAPIPRVETHSRRGDSPRVLSLKLFERFV